LYQPTDKNLRIAANISSYVETANQISMKFCVVIIS